MSGQKFTEISEMILMPWLKESAVLGKFKRVKFQLEADYESDEESIRKESKKCF
jgi:hypothetical protein